MARRKSKAKQQEELIQGVTGLIIFGSLIGTYYLTRSIQASLIACVLSFVLFIVVLIILAVKRVDSLKKSGIADIDKRDGIQFEKYLGYLFKVQGYKVAVTKASGDYGADLVIQKAYRRIVVQAKRYSKNVGIKAVQEAQAAISHYSASEAWVVTNSDYTSAAYDLAKSNNVRLINRDELVEMILNLNPKEVPTAKAVIASTPKDQLSCPKCASKLVLRKGSKGEFYGCSAFPRCRYTQDI